MRASRMDFDNIGKRVKNMRELNEYVTSNPAKQRMVWIYAEWCGHCIHFLPTWREMVNSDDGSTEFIVMDGSNGDLKPVDGYPRVIGFPTIWMFANGASKPTEYRGSRTRRDIQMKLNSMNK